MIGEDIIFPLTIPPGDIYTVFQLLLPTILTRTRCGCPLHPNLVHPARTR